MAITKQKPGKALKRSDAKAETQVQHVVDHYRTMNGRIRRLCDLVEDALEIEGKGAYARAQQYGRIYFKLHRVERMLVAKDQMVKEWPEVVTKEIPYPEWPDEERYRADVEYVKGFVEHRRHRVDYSRVDLNADHFRWLPRKKEGTGIESESDIGDDYTLGDQGAEKNGTGWLGSLFSFYPLGRTQQVNNVTLAEKRGRFEPKDANWERNLEVPETISANTGAVRKRVNNIEHQQKQLGEQVTSTPKVNRQPVGPSFRGREQTEVRTTFYPDGQLDDEMFEGVHYATQVPFNKKESGVAEATKLPPNGRFVSEPNLVTQTTQRERVPLRELAPRNQMGPNCQPAVTQQGPKDNTNCQIDGNNPRNPWGRRSTVAEPDKQQPGSGVRLPSVGTGKQPPASVGHLSSGGPQSQPNPRAPSAPQAEDDSDPNLGGRNAFPQKKYDRHLYEMIEKFTGDPLRFESFINAFCEAVDDTDLPVSFKLNRLKNKLDERSREMIENYPPTQYEKAKQTLCDRYIILVNIVRNIRKKADDLPCLKRTDDTETFGKIVEQLRAINEVIKDRAVDGSVQVEIFRMLISKLPFRVYEKYTEKLGNDQPDLDEFLTVLETKYKAALTQDLYGREANGDEKRGKESKKPFKKEYKGHANAVENHRRDDKGVPPPFAGGGTFRGRGGHGQMRPRSAPEQRGNVRNLPCRGCPNSSHTTLYCPLVSVHEKLRIAREHGLCFRCLRDGHSSQKCLSKERCRYCGEMRHHNQLCFKATRPKRVDANNVRISKGRSRQDDDGGVFGDSLRRLLNETTYNVFNVDLGDNADTLIPIIMRVNGRRIKALVDTGASVNLMPTSVAQKLGLTITQAARALRTPQGEFVANKAAEALVNIGDRIAYVDFLLYDERQVILLGTPVVTKFKLVIDFNLGVHQLDSECTRYSPVETPPKGCVLGVSGGENVEIDFGEKTLKELLVANQSVFSESGRKIGLITTEKCHLRLTSEVPINLRHYRCSNEDQEIIDAHVKELKAQGLIRDSTSPYSFPVVLVDKKDEGKKSRVCINYIKLNEVTQTEHFPIQKIDDIKDMFLGARYFTTVDIASGFHHILVNEADIPKTAFSTMNGHYEWLRMPFGLKNAPVIFQRVIANLIRKHGLQKFALNYIDDIMVFSRTYDEHMQHLQSLFDMVKAENIRLKLSKCQFGKKEVVYLGFKIGQDSFAPLHSNTVAIEKAPPPTDLKTLRGFLGKINFYHRFVPNRAVLLHPLYQLLKKQVPWSWGEEAQTAFEAVKAILTSAPVLRIFDPKWNTFLYTDASRKGIGAVLKQSDPSDPEAYQYAIGYFSKPLVTYQQNYSVSELELLAIVSAIDYWHYYLISVFFTIITDHLPLKGVNKFSKPSTRLFNWAMRLRQYRFKVEYLPGAQNHEADYLSRHPVKMLEEITAGHVMWVDAERIKAAQASMTEEYWPRKVKRIEKNGQSKLVYVKGDQEKDYLPDELAREVLEELHLEKGHIGYKAMEKHFSRIYYCVRMAEIIKKIVKECSVCIQVKVPHRKYGTMGAIGPAERPMEIVHIDTKSGFRGYGSQKDNLHIAIDAFTRFVWAISSRSKLGGDFINLVEKISSLGKPRLIVADNYPAIKGREFQNYLKNNEIGMIFVAANHQSANGMVERVNQTLVERLRCKRLEKPKSAWTTLVKECIHEYNNSIHSVTQFTPMYLLMGEDKDGLFKEYTLEEARELAFKNSNERHSDNARMRDKGRRDPALEPEDLVYVQAQHSLNRKALDPPYVGPYPVKERIGRTTYEVEKNGKIEKYHVSQLKAVETPKFLPKRSLMATLVMALLCLFISTSAQQVTTTGPLLWRRTDNPAVVGFDYATHVAVLPNPCDILKPAPRMRRTAADETAQEVVAAPAEGKALIARTAAADPPPDPVKLDMDVIRSSVTDYVTCNDYYQARVLDHLQTECKLTENVGVLGKQSHRVARRNKRFLPLLAGAVGGLISYGLMALLPDWRFDLGSGTVSHINDQMREELELIKKGDNLTRQFQERVVAQLETITKLKEAVRAESKTIRILMAIFSLLDRTEVHLQYLLEGFHHGKVTPDYRMLFPGSPLLKGTPLRYWTSHGCELVNNDTFVMKFEKPLLSPAIKVLRVVPFLIVGKEKGKSDQECLKSFKGNQYVLWNNVTNCTRDLLSEPQYPTDLVIVNDSPLASCISHSNRTEKWQDLECGMSSLKEQILQVHRDENTYLVYCYRRELKVEGNDPFTCENTVYRFPAILSFWVDGIRYEARKDYIDSKFDIGMAITDLINHRTFFPSLGSSAEALKDLSKLIREEKRVDDQLEWKPLLKSPYFHLSATTILLIVVALIIVVICCLRFGKEGPRYIERVWGTTLGGPRETAETRF